jgi:hypothetical protein
MIALVILPFINVGRSGAWYLLLPVAIAVEGLALLLPQ